MDLSLADRAFSIALHDLAIKVDHVSMSSRKVLQRNIPVQPIPSRSRDRAWLPFLPEGREKEARSV